MSAVPSIAPDGDSVAIGMAAQGMDTLREINSILDALHVGEDRLEKSTTTQLLFAAQSLIKHEIERLDAVYIAAVRSAGKALNLNGPEVELSDEAKKVLHEVRDTVHEADRLKAFYRAMHRNSPGDPTPPEAAA